MIKFSKYAHKFIKAASKNPLGFCLGVAFLLCSVAIAFFICANDYVKALIFFPIFLGLLVFAYAVILTMVRRKPESTTPMINTPGEEPKADQAAAVCYRRLYGQTEYLLIRSTGGRRLFPKGTREVGESLRATAINEAKEEGGVWGNVSKEKLLTYWHYKGITGKCFAVAVYLIEVVDPNLPNKKKKKKKQKPTWYSFSKAEVAISKKRKPAHAEPLLQVLRAADSKIQDSC